jgi:hypothetical protein
MAEFYYTPTKKKELSDITIYDPNFITNAGRIGIKKLNNYFKKNKLRVDFQLAQKIIQFF